jgi:hypothetical protein
MEQRSIVTLFATFVAFTTADIGLQCSPVFTLFYNSLCKRKPPGTESSTKSKKEAVQAIQKIVALIHTLVQVSRSLVKASRTVHIQTLGPRS